MEAIWYPDWSEIKTVLRWRLVSPERTVCVFDMPHGHYSVGCFGRIVARFERESQAVSFAVSLF